MDSVDAARGNEAGTGRQGDLAPPQMPTLLMGGEDYASLARWGPESSASMIGPACTKSGALAFGREQTSSPAQLTLSCKDLTYKIRSSKRSPITGKWVGAKQTTTRTVLEGVNAIFRAGRLTAIMGASGSGKTTLLNALARGDSTLINGRSVAGYNAAMSDIAGYVHQDDQILSTMTVREAITMSVTLRPHVQKEAHPTASERVDRVISIMGLEQCQHTIIGSSIIRGVSGGERKRTSIAMEIITDPAILFLDEPTSGLDTLTAFNVTHLLWSLAHAQGRTVVATIHQPSSEMFHLFDDLVILDEGRVIYHGEAYGIIGYCEMIGLPCPQFTNPADHVFMTLLNNPQLRRSSRQNVEATIESRYGASGEDREAIVCDHFVLVGYWENSLEKRQLDHDLICLEAEAKGTIAEGSLQASLRSALRRRATFMVQLSYLTQRSMKNVWRNKMVVQLKVMQSLIVGLLIGIIFLRVQTKPFETQTQNRKGALFFIILNQFMGSSMGVLSAFSHDRSVFLREHSQGYYSLSAYYLTKVVTETPFYIASSIFLISICYFMIGFQANALRFLVLNLDGMLVSLCGMSLGLFFGAAFPNMNAALAAMPLVLLPLILFSGLYVNAGSIPGWLSWIMYISPSYYAFNAAVKNEFTTLELPECPAPLPSPCSGKIALDQLSMNGFPSITTSFILLAGMSCILSVAAYCALFLLCATHGKRKG